MIQPFPEAPRPWPAPQRPWVLAMRWHHLLFLHWPIPPAALHELIPSGLTLDTFKGQAWIGLVPFGMEKVRPRGTPALPWISAFPELNLRTYVVADEKPGVWFFSLDAGNPVAVRLARHFFHLPYFDAEMSLQSSQDQVSYTSRRTHRGAPAAHFVASYHPTGPPMSVEEGTIDHWLTARYCLYTEDPQGRLWRGEIHHPPWPLQPAELDLQAETMTRPLGLQLPQIKPLLHYSRELEVVAWGLEQLP